ncbi:MAG: hypothetical protein ABI778_11525 [Ignavibacteriota bacterium]
MRSNCILLLLFVLLSGCAKSEKLNDQELNYVKLNLAMMKARTASSDSVALGIKLDSVYKKFGTSEAEYKIRTTGFEKEPDRANIIFRAIADSMNVK